MPDVLDDLLFPERLAPAELAKLRGALAADPALREHLARWETLRAALRTRLDGAVPDRSLLVLHALDDLGEALSDEECRTLQAARADLERAFQAHPALADIIGRIQAECRAFDAVWAAHVAPAEAPATVPPATMPSRKPSAVGRPAAARASVPHAARPVHRPLRWATRAALALALVAFVAVAVLVLQRDQGLLHVEADAPMAITLADGTTVRLMAGTRLSYPDPAVETAFRRRVRLVGDAFFDVAPRREPFVVETPTALATVLGTRFGVRAAEAMTEVVLVSGRVGLAATAAPEQMVTLAPGEMSRVAAGALPATPSPTNLDAALSWTGLFLFRSLPAAEIADRLTHHYGVSVTVSTVLAAEEVTGTFDRAQPLTEVLAAVAAALDADVYPTENGYRME